MPSYTEGSYEPMDQHLGPVSPHDVSRAAIESFMQRTGISVVGLRCDPDGMVERRVREIVKPWDIGDVSPANFNAHLIAGVNIATTAYSHTPFNVQVHIAVYTLLTISVDDIDIEPIALEEFMNRLHTGTRQRHPLLQHLVNNLAAMEKFFPPFASKAIVTSTINFVNQTLIDHELKNMPINQAALPFIEYKRIKNGVAEAYGYFIWDKYAFPNISSHIQVISDTRLYLNYCNDIFSFFKEELIGDTNNYVHNRAHVTKKTVPEALLDVVEDVVAAVERARVILQEGEMKEVLERFLAGYVVFHFFSPRYKLQDLTGTQYL